VLTSQMCDDPREKLSCVRRVEDVEWASLERSRVVDRNAHSATMARGHDGIGSGKTGRHTA
jgi:hypothetical protein